MKHVGFPLPSEMFHTTKKDKNEEWEKHEKIRYTIKMSALWRKIKR